MLRRVINLFIVFLTRETYLGYGSSNIYDRSISKSVCSHRQNGIILLLFFLSLIHVLFTSYTIDDNYGITTVDISIRMAYVYTTVIVLSICDQTLSLKFPQRTHNFT